MLIAGLWVYSHLSGDLGLRNYGAAAGNHKFISLFFNFAILGDPLLMLTFVRKYRVAPRLSEDEF